MEEYKYVGVMVGEDGGWKRAAKRVLEKAGGTSRAMRWWLGRHWGVSPRAKVTVWEAVVGAQLRYGSEVWWPGVLEERELEKVQLAFLKDVLRLNRSTTNEFVRGEVGRVEVKREREQAMLVWLGRLVCMKERRWPRRLFEKEWKQGRGRRGVKRLKMWRTKVDEVVEEYGLRGELENLKIGKKMEEWRKNVREKVEKRAVQEWRDGVRRGKKLEVYLRIKERWGFEEYLEGVLGRGEVLLARFRSGSAAVGSETGRWFGGRTGVWAEDGTERKRVVVCGLCERGVEETVEHVLIECEAFEEEREEWRRAMEGELGVGWSERVGFPPFELMLGRRVPGLGAEGRLTCWVASACLCAKLWSKRADLKYGQRPNRLESMTHRVTAPT